MDYVKAYNKICENHSNQIDFINFVENKLEDFNRFAGINDEELMRRSESLRKVIDKVKATETILLKELHELEIMCEVSKWQNKN